MWFCLVVLLRFSLVFSQVARPRYVCSIRASVDLERTKCGSTFSFLFSLLFSLFSLFRYPPFFLNACCRIHTLSVLRLDGNHRIQVYSLLPYPTAFLPQDVFNPRLLTAGALDWGPSSRLHVSDSNCIFMKARCLVPKLTTRLPLRLTVFILLPANSSTDRDFFTGPFSSLMRREPQLNTIGHRSVRANILKVIRPAL